MRWSRSNPRDTSPRELADVFSHQARRRVEQKFREVWANDDALTYTAARHFLDDHFTWLEDDLVPMKW